MAQIGYTPILIYSSSTASNAPLAANLTNSTLGSELAINITDGKLFYKDNANAIQVIGWKTTPTTAGGTGLTSYTAGDLLYYASGTTLTKLAIGASTTIMTSSGTAPQWSAAFGITVGKATNLDGGVAGSVPYQTGVGSTTFLGIGAANTVLTSSGSAPQWSTALTLSGNVTAAAFIPSGSSVPANGMYYPTTNVLSWATNSTLKMTLDSVGNLSTNTSTNNVYDQVAGARALLIQKSDTSTTIGASLASITISNSDTTTSNAAQLNFAAITGASANQYSAAVIACIFGARTNGQYPTGSLAFLTSTSLNSAPTEKARIWASGGVSIGNTTDPGATNLSVTGDGFFGGSTSNSRVNIKAASGFRALSVQRSNGDEYFYTDNDNAVSTGANAADTVLFMTKITSTSRSINAAGTLNASGADYAEYMTKAGNFVIAKGDVCGVDAEGKLTNVFANAVSFVVKSSDPSFVGGDTWGADLEGDELEAARQKVDRVAFAGQVPVNITNAAPGQYIVPIDDGGAIKPSAVDEANMTLAMYMKSVGKVIAIEPNGRAKIIVKTA